jgi:penicillin amidase
MDISTRSPDGRLSEILGSNLLDYDKKQRRLGLSYAADNAVKGWKKFPELIKNVDAYSAGVNHYISSLSVEDYPMEYKLLDFKPSEWTNRHCALLLKAMSQTLAGYEEDIEMSNALKVFGQEDFDLIYPDRNPKDIPVIQGPYTKVNTSSSNQEIPNLILGSIDRPRSPDGVGSNNWAVSGSKSATGKPILANDPHLGLSLPSVWYEIAITTPEFSAQGVTLLGMPGIMIGFNEDIAWGETNVGHDVMDYHTISWANEEKTKYFLDSVVTDANLKIETYKIKGGLPVYDTVRYTHWGPVVEDENNLALRWIVHDESPTPDFMTFINGMTCNNYDDYLTATATFHAPAQNFIYADKHDEIGLRVNGNLPIKDYRQGVTISKGDSKKDGWKGIIPRNETPQERNPDKGYVTSCNQYSASEDYPNYYNGNFEPYRGRMANRLLTAKDTLDVADFKAMQNSNHSILAEEALPIMLSLLDTMVAAHPHAQWLRDWNYSYDANSTSAVKFDSWFTFFHEMLWDEVYKQDSIDMPAPDAWVTVNLIEKFGSHKFYDIVGTPEVEDLVYLVNESFKYMLDPDPATLSQVKNAQILHLTKLPAFSEMGLALGGTKHSLNAMQQSFGPSWRMVVALGEEPEAYGTYPGGQSGNPASPFYKNRIATWAKGEYDRLVLAPTPDKISKSLFTITVTNEE